MLIDTHAHLYVSAFAADRAAMVARALAVCSHIVLPNIDRASLPELLALAAAHPGRLLPAAGLHPCHVVVEPPDSLEALLAALEAELATGRYCAVGETGLDLYWDRASLPLQIESLRRHIGWALSHDLPIILHSRSAHDETLAQVRWGCAQGPLRGVFHCFTGSAEQALAATELGFYLGIGGVLTYPKQDALHAALLAAPRDRILLETDAPYLPPVPHRGQRNESAHISLVAQRLATLWGTTPEDVAALTSANARRLFGIGPDGA